MKNQSPKNLNLPQSKLPYERTEEEKLFLTVQWQIFRIMAEFVDGFDFINKYEKSVTVFGSSRISEDDYNYKLAMDLGEKVSAMGYALITGGGPGIMEAANRGAAKQRGQAECFKKKENVCGESVGLNIRLPKEQRVNPYVSESLGFRFFFTRKLMLSFSAEAYVFFPGGFGTLDEFFEILTLVQCHKIAQVPIILMGRKFWTPLTSMINSTLYQRFKAIDRDDMKLYKMVDTVKEAVAIIKKAPIRKFTAPDNITA